MADIKILGLSGSLRAVSLNSALLRAMARLAPSDIDFIVCQQLGQLPLFNPDLETQLPATAAEFHHQVAAADALVIASPEYAHGVSGTIKNALDWLVSFEPFVYKPVAIINASPRAHHANAALRETLITMSATIIEPASISIPLHGSGLDEAGMLAHPQISQSISDVLIALLDAIAKKSSSKPQ